MAPLAALLVLVLALAAGAAESATDAASAPAAAGPLNLTAILEKGGQYTTFLRLLKETQVGTQIESQLNNSFNGMTIFAPTDNAFNNLKAGTLNSLATQQQVSLVLFHVLPRYYSPSSFETTSNPVSTQASGRNGVYTVNITSTTNQVNVSTGVNDAPVNNKLYMDFPLAVYSVDQVLLPSELFGVPAPAASPQPHAATAKPKDKTKTPVTAADAPETSADQSTSAAGLRSWSRTAEGVLLLLAMSVASLLL